MYHLHSKKSSVEIVSKTFNLFNLTFEIDKIRSVRKINRVFNRHTRSSPTMLDLWKGKGSLQITAQCQLQEIMVIHSIRKHIESIFNQF